MEAYQAALRGETALKRMIGESRSRSGTVGAVVDSYFSSKTFQRLAGATRQWRAADLKRFSSKYSDRYIRDLQVSHIKNIINEENTLTMRNRLLSALRALMVHCIDDLNIREDDPTRAVKLLRIETDGHYTWNEDDIVTFEKTHPIGSRARKAFALLLYTLQRRSDILTLGPQNIRNGAFRIRQQKTGTTLSIPVHPDLMRILEATPMIT